jgi:hypothetical protein
MLDAPHEPHSFTCSSDRKWDMFSPKGGLLAPLQLCRFSLGMSLTPHYHSFRSGWVSLTWHVHTPGGCVNQASHNNLRIRCLPFRVSLQRLDSHVPTQKYWHSHCVSCGSGCGQPLRMDKWCNMDARFWGKSEGGAVELWLLWCSQGSKPTHVIWELFASKSSGMWFPTELL